MLKASLSPNPFPNSVPLNGANFPSGSKLYIWLDVPSAGAKTPFTFQPSGQRENAFPIEYKGGAAVTFPDGANTVRVFDSTSTSVALDSATFTVGSTTPPPTTKETVKVTANMDKVEIVTVHDPNL